MVRRAAWLAGVLIVVASSVAAAEAPPRDIDELRAKIARVLLREQVPGAGIALIDGDRILWAGGVGLADRATGAPVTADTLFRVGSITKSFVALALVVFAERGRIDLRAPVSALAPELAIGNRWAAEQPITVAHLLEHTAGFDEMHPNEWAAPLADEAMPLADVLARNPASRVARWRPGSRFSYANPDYTVAGYLIERVTGRPYEDVLARELFAPLGMTGAALRWSPAVDARLARGYGEAEAAVPYRAIYHRPAGNLMASPRELAALVQLALARGRFGGRAVISPAGMARIERSETAWLSPGAASYGLGNFGDVAERALIRGHTGGIDGFLSMYGYLPDHGVGFVMLLNSTRSWRAVTEIRHLLVEFLLAGAPVAPPPRVPTPADELRRWAGTYHAAAPRQQLFAFLERTLPGVELYVERDRLFGRTVPATGEPFELIPLGGGRFRLPIASAGHIQLGHDRDGRRVMVAGTYFVEEPRTRTLAYAVVPPICLWLLATGLVLPLGLLRRRVGPTPGVGWPVCASASLFTAAHLFAAAHEPFVVGERNAYTVGICVLTWLFALAAMASLVQALVWLPRPGSLITRLHRLCFGLAACLATAYLAAYGIIGIRLWSY
ncbi:MAG TPA: serine hydrolase domain-containing protein [Kofleriaceae bacterium]|nr:serine hydrolase domain-containing protein [Kofleriaceae bacterium]